MSIAFISDIHGNLKALDAVLADADKAGVDEIICLGDVADLGVDSLGVISRLRERDIPCIMGNHDAYLLDDAQLFDERGECRERDWVVEHIRKIRAHMTSEDFAFVQSFVPSIERSFEDGNKLLAYHGKPRSFFGGCLPQTPVEELKQSLENLEHDVFVCGHTHVQFQRQLPSAVYVNAGSVGMPFEHFPFEGVPTILPAAAYCIVNSADGVVSVDLRRVPCNFVGEMGAVPG